jgi:radical SAM protein with 4Fe4S-binding SPASM domain
MNRERGVMNFGLFKQLIDKIVSERACGMVNLYGFGEPYLTPSYLVYCDYAIERLNKAGINTAIISNGMVITEIPKGVGVFAISFNAGKKETFERITKLDFDRTYQNMKRLHKQRQFKRARQAEIHFLAFEDNKNEVRAFLDLFKDFKGVNLRIGYKYDNQRGLIEDKTLPEFRGLKRIPCHYLLNVLNVTWNGEVSLCPHDENNAVVFGNAFESSFSEIEKNSNRKAFLEKQYKGVYDGVCENCNFNVGMDGLYFTFPNAKEGMKYVNQKEKVWWKKKISSKSVGAILKRLP